MCRVLDVLIVKCQWIELRWCEFLILTINTCSTFRLSMYDLGYVIWLDSWMEASSSGLECSTTDSYYIESQPSNTIPWLSLGIGNPKNDILIRT